MKYFELELTISPFNNEINEILIAQFSEIGYDNFFENNEGFKAYLNERPDVNLFIPLIKIFNNENCKIDFKINEIESKNWNEEWEKTIQPLVIDGKCLIYTSFHANLPKCEYEILIDPKMSFGTGHHQTTEMMVQYILETDFTNKVVLDAGCGTGILAILASKRGATKVVAFDYDDNCVENCLENVQKNNVNNIHVIKADENSIFKEKIDVILANINRNVLVNYYDMFSGLLNKNGIIVLSGFYTEDVSYLNDIYSKTFKLLSEKENSNWSSLMFQKI